jgi:hypothetical protein
VFPFFQFTAGRHMPGRRGFILGHDFHQPVGGLPTIIVFFHAAWPSSPGFAGEEKSPEPARSFRVFATKEPKIAKDAFFQKGRDRRARLSISATDPFSAIRLDGYPRIHANAHRRQQRSLLCEPLSFISSENQNF